MGGCAQVKLQSSDCVEAAAAPTSSTKTTQFRDAGSLLCAPENRTVDAHDFYLMEKIPLEATPLSFITPRVTGVPHIVVMDEY
jgi:hypothetical protein